MTARNVVRLWKEGLESGDKLDLASSAAVKFVPVVNNQGSVEVGNGSLDMDLKVYQGADGSYVLFDSSAKQLVLSGVAVSSGTAVTEATAARTVTSADFGKVIRLTKSDGATTVTLPAAAAGNVGARVKVLSTTDQAHVVALTNGIVAPSTLTSDSLTAATASKVGQYVELESDGSKWVVVAWTGTWTVAA